jgi:peptidoglycan/LPS O-acetylase OafA/YrhL
MTGDAAPAAGIQGQADRVEADVRPLTSAEARVHEIDGLRGLAISAVVLYHWVALPMVSILSPLGVSGVLRLLAHGVDLFFVISGYLIGTILLKVEGPAGIGAFYVRRILRIWPLYYLLLFLVYSSLRDKGMFSDAPLASFFLFIFNYWESFGARVHTALGPLWSIAIEEQFYVVGPLVFALVNRRVLPFLLLAALILGPVVRVTLVETMTVDIWRFTPARMDGICLGLLLSIFLSSPANVRFVAGRLPFFRTLAVVLLILLVPARYFMADTLFSIVGLSLVVLAFGCVLLVVQVQSSLRIKTPLLNWTVLRWLGLRCYSIYLFHIFFALIAISIFNNFYLDLLIKLALLLLFAHFSWKYIEAPLISVGRKFPYRRSAA